MSRSDVPTVAGLQSAYAVTCHKLQGAEMDSLLYILGDSFWLKQDEWRYSYTAVTRAKKIVYFAALT